MRWHKEQNIVCFTKTELESLFKEAKQLEILKALKERRLSFDDLANNNDLKNEIVDSIVLKSGKDKDEVEIFVVSNMLPDFYDNECEICFSLRDGFNLAKDPIKSLSDLKVAIKEKSDVDFWILKGGFRAFQLKRYREELTNDALLSFIKKKVA